LRAACPYPDLRLENRKRKSHADLIFAGAAGARLGGDRAELLSGGEKNRQDEISELMKDQFIAEIMPFVRS